MEDDKALEASEARMREARARTLLVREGDVLVVSYPEVKIPLLTKYSTVTIGGLIYTRRLAPGDNVPNEYDKIYGFLKGMAERDAREKVKVWTEELANAHRRPPPLPLAPKPAGAVHASGEIVCGECLSRVGHTAACSQFRTTAAGARPKPTTAVQR